MRREMKKATKRWALVAFRRAVGSRAHLRSKLKSLMTGSRRSYGSIPRSSQTPPFLRVVITRSGAMCRVCSPPDSGVSTSHAGRSRLLPSGSPARIPREGAGRFVADLRCLLRRFNGEGWAMTARTRPQSTPPLVVDDLRQQSDQRGSFFPARDAAV